MSDSCNIKLPKKKKLMLRDLQKKKKTLNCLTSTDLRQTSPENFDHQSSSIQRETNLAKSMEASTGQTIHKKPSVRRIGRLLQSIHPILRGKDVTIEESLQLAGHVELFENSTRNYEEEMVRQLCSKNSKGGFQYADAYLRVVRETLSPNMFEGFVRALKNLDYKQIKSEELTSTLWKECEPFIGGNYELIEGFQQFIQMQQSEDLVQTHQSRIFNQAYAFLKLCKHRYKGDDPAWNKFLKMFAKIKEEPQSVSKIKVAVLKMLNQDPFLQEEFLMLFDDERPPVSRLVEEHESMTWHDDLAKKISKRTVRRYSFELLTIHRGRVKPTDPAGYFEKETQKFLKQKKCEAVSATSTTGKSKVVSKNKDLAASKNSYIKVGKKTSDSTSTETSSNVDALEPSVTSSKPMTESVRSLFHSYALSSDKEKLHAQKVTTATGKGKRPSSSNNRGKPALKKKRLSKSEEKRAAAEKEAAKLPIRQVKGSEIDQLVSWSREQDTDLLETCKKFGTANIHKAFHEIAERLRRTEEEVERRFHKLIAVVRNSQLQNDSSTDNEDSSSYESTSNSESDD